MAQEASGLPYGSTNPSGSGAVYFQPTVEPLRLHLDNLNRLDNTDDFWKAWNLAQAGEQKKAKIAADITKDLETDYKGAMPEDIKTRFEPQRQELLGRYAKLMQGGANLNNIQRNPEYQQILAGMNQLKGDVMRSAELGKLFVDASSKYSTDPSKYDDTMLGDMAKGRLMDLDARQKFVSERGGVLVKQKQADLETSLQDSLKNFAPYVFDITEKPVTKDGQAFVEQVKVADPKKVLGSSRAFVLNRAKDVDAKWNSMPVEAQQHYADAAAIESKIQGEEINPKEYFVYKWFRDKLGDQKSLTGGSFTPERQEAAKQKTEQEKFNAMYDLVNAVAEINPEVYVKSNDGQPIRTDGKYYTSTNLGGLVIGTRQAADGSTVPDLIVATRVDPANSNIIEIRTDKDASSDQTGTQFTKKITRDELLYQLAISNFNDPAAAMTYMRKAAAKKNDVTSAGVIVPTQTTNATTVLTANEKATGNFPKAERTNAGVAVIKEQGAKQPKTLKEEDDPKSLVIGEEYILNGKRVKWNGKNLVVVK